MRPVVHRIKRGRICGGVAIGAIYGIATFASIGLFQTPSTSPHHAASILLGLINVAVLPLLMLAAVANIRRIWREGAPNPRLARLVMAPLWVSFVLALLTVPLWMAMANVEQHGAVALHYSPTFLLAPWGFMLAYGFALLITCAMFDFTFPVTMEAQPQLDTLSRQRQHDTTVGAVLGPPTVAAP